MPIEQGWVKDVHHLRPYTKKPDREYGSHGGQRHIFRNVYEADQARGGDDDQTTDTHRTFAEIGKLIDARAVWPEIWKQNLVGNQSLGSCIIHHNRKEI